MIDIIPVSEPTEWDSIVRSFDNFEVYYLSEYVKAFEINGDGIPELFYFHDDCSRAICVMMRRDISDDPHFTSLESGKYFDLITPYGYGGFFFDRVPDETSVQKLHNELIAKCSVDGYVSAFFRFNPLSDNAAIHHKPIEVIYLGKTIAIDLATPEIIWQNITSKNRNMIRKAQKAGVEIKHGKGMMLLDTFKKIYDETMRHDNADEYYFFGKEFYESIDRCLNNNYEIFYAEYEGKIIAMSIMLFAGHNMHYHLSGSLYEYRNLAPSNLLLYKAALWGNEHGFKTFHLGGGVGSGEDNLYKFKAAFNRNSECQFAIGKLIIDNDKYNKLLSIRNFTTEELSQISFFPTYRATIKNSETV